MKTSYSLDTNLREGVILGMSCRVITVHIKVGLGSVHQGVNEEQLFPPKIKWHFLEHPLPLCLCIFIGCQETLDSYHHHNDTTTIIMVFSYTSDKLSKV